MSFTQLNPPIPLHVVGKGDGYAIGVIDYSQEHYLHFVVGINETGEVWIVDNRFVRMQKNISLNRVFDKDKETK